MPMLVDIDGGVGRLVISRPEALNAIDFDLSIELSEAWERMASDDAVRVVVLTGDGDRAFCAGADLKTLLPLILAGGYQEGVGAEGNVFAKAVPLYKPVVAAVNGDAIAGGTELLQATDLRIAVEGARFGLQEVRWALFPAGGSSVRLARQIPYCLAMEILLTGRLIEAEEAVRFGLINKVVPREQFDDEVEKIVDELLRNGPIATEAVKESVLTTQGMTLPEAFRKESELSKRVFETEDAHEGPRSFIEKREPVYKGK